MWKLMEMTEHLCDYKGWYENKKQYFVRVTPRWVKVKTNYNVSPRNPLWDYARDENGNTPYQSNFDKNTATLDYFEWNGRKWAVEQFLALGNPFWCAVAFSYEDEDGKTNWLSGVDADNYYNPIYIELSECGEQVRVYIRK